MELLLDNLNWVFDGIGVAVGGWIIYSIYKYLVLLRDGKRVYQWLENNTQNEPPNSHKTLLEISEGIRLSEERVRKACLQNKQIFQSVKHPGLYSIWYVEPKSIYSKRGLRLIE